MAVDRKSTRLNSSHLGISYAVFCLKKKKKKKKIVNRIHLWYESQSIRAQIFVTAYSYYCVICHLVHLSLHFFLYCFFFFFLNDRAPPDFSPFPLPTPFPF